MGHSQTKQQLELNSSSTKTSTLHHTEANQDDLSCGAHGDESQARPEHINSTCPTTNSTVHGHCLPAPLQEPRRKVSDKTHSTSACSSVSGCNDNGDETDLILRAALPHHGCDPPVVSLAALQAAFNHLPYAIAVVRVAGDGLVTSSDKCIADDHNGTQVLPGGDASLPITASHDAAAGPPLMGAPLMAGADSGAASSRPLPQPSLFAGSNLYTAMGDSRELAISSPAGSGSCHAENTFAVRVPNQSGWHLEEQELAYAIGQTNADGVPASAVRPPSTRPSRRRGSDSFSIQGRGFSVVDKEDTPCMARLQPVYLNAAVEQMLEMNGYEEFSSYMDTQLHRNPMLVMMLESSVQRLMRGVATSVKQYMPTFQSASSTDSAAQPPFISLQISSCGFEDADGIISPGLFLWYNAPSKQLELTSQLKRDYMALAHVPSMISVIAMDGRVLHQNGSSVAYMGFAMGSLGSHEARHISSMHHNLRRLFCLEPEALVDMLNAVADGKTWHGLLQMPPTLDLTERFLLSVESDCLSQECASPNSSCAIGEWHTSLVSSPLCSAEGKLLPAGGSEPVVQRHIESGSCNSLDPEAKLAGGKALHRTNSDRPPSRGHAKTSLQPDRRKAAEGLHADSSSEADLSATRQLSAPHAAAPVTTSVSPAAHTAAAATGRRTRRMSLEIPHNISFSRAPAVHHSAANSTESNLLLNSRAMRMLLGSKAGQSKADGSRSAQSAGKPRRPAVRASSDLQRSLVELTQSVNTTRWHQVQANKFTDPVTGEDVIMIIQTDMTPQILAEQQLRQVLDAEHVLLEEIFPRQVLEVMTAASIRKHISSSKVIGGLQCNATSGNRIKLALQHEQVSIMFADIVGFTAMSKQVEPAVVMTFLNDLYTE